ncbi:MAG TPA: hypothetical protein VGF92_17790 [Stellaceae bacterium]|jgi:EAL domain-containing protein (putative c-di-GMP-specific phosphodiesterase class I)
MVQVATDRTPNVEHLLHDFTGRLERHPFGWRAVVLNLSRLRPDNRRAQQIRVAANTFEGLVRHFEGQIFLLAQGDIVFICKDADVSAVDSAVNKVRYLFGDDPLATAIDDIQSDGFSTWYDLSRDYVKFAGFVDNLYAEEQRRLKRLATIAGDTQRDVREPMDPTALAELVKIIERADLTNVIRRQAICAIVANEAPKPVYREVYVSIPDLRNSVMPKRDIASDRWLFQYLTQTLDRRVLTMLRRGDDSALAHSYSVNLNISTLLSPEFQAFDQSLRSGTRGSIIIEVEKVDIFNDIGAYIFARDYVHERGYRICLDGVTALTLPYIDRERLGIDLIKVFWSPDIGDPARPERAAEVKAAIERAGKSRVIIARCDNADAVRFGHESGVHLFQGRHIDRMLSAGSAPAAARGKLAPPSQVAAGGAR